MREFFFASSSYHLSTKKALNIKEIIRTHSKILNPWYARSVVDWSILQDLFFNFASGEFDDGGKKQRYSNNTGQKNRLKYISRSRFRRAVRPPALALDLHLG